jgi:Flp pilus assembly pilin Flp
MTLKDKISAVFLALALVAGFVTLAVVSTGQLTKAKAHTHYTEAAQ